MWLEKNSMQYWVRKMKWIVPLVILGATLIFLFLYRDNRFTLEIDLRGEQEIFLEYGETYKEQGATLWFWGTMLIQEGMEPNTELQIDNGILPGHVGRFVVKYSARYFGVKAEAERIVWVVDTKCPVIELFSSGYDAISSGIYHEEGYRATDNYDGDITHLVVCTKQEGKITYGVVDSSGNPCYAERIVPGYDPIPPEIVFAGDEKIVINTGVYYEEPGFEVWDNVDGDLTGQTAVEGDVVWYQPGIYHVTYTVTDSYQNTATRVRTVEVTGNPWQEEVIPDGKVIYLTFDDGPGIYTSRLLDILDKYDVKATFFVVGTGDHSVMKEIVQRGHSIGIHSLTHDYKEIYESPEAFFRDLYGMQDHIHQITGVETTLMRFPGGSSNTVSAGSPGLMSLLTKAVQDAGFQYFDWNVDSKDARGAYSKNTVLNHMIAGIEMQDVSVVLQHDIYLFSIEAVDELIRWGQENGYTFLPLQQNSPAMHHDVVN